MLLVNQLIGFGSGGGGGPVSITRTATPLGQGTSSNVATYSSQSIGVADPSRIVAVLVTAKATTSINSATIDYGSGDISMTSVGSAVNSDSRSRYFELAVPTGTTATIKITYSGFTSGDNTTIVVYSIRNGTRSNQGTDNKSNIETTPLSTGSITIPQDGGFLAIAAHESDTAPFTWSNATEDVDAAVSNSYRQSTATRTTTGTVTITATCSSAQPGSLVWAVYTSNG